MAAQTDTSRWILVAGSVPSVKSRRFEPFARACQALGAALAKNGYAVLGSSFRENTADPHILKGAKTSGGEVRVVCPKPQKIQDEELLDIPVEQTGRSWKETRQQQVEHAAALVAIGGATHTGEAVDAADAAGLPILLIPAFEGTASTRFSTYHELYLKRGVGTGHLDRLEKWTDSSPDAVVELLKHLLSPEPENKAESSQSTSPAPNTEEETGRAGTGTTQETPIVYISYAHQDEAWRQRILDTLKPAAARSGFRIWHDGMLETGEQLEPRLEQIRNQAVAAIVVLSQSWLDSEYIQSQEWPHLRSRVPSGLRLLPILVTQCRWKASDIQGFNLFPPMGHPLDKGDVDALLSEFAGRVSTAVEGVVGRPAESQDLPPPSLDLDAALQPEATARRPWREQEVGFNDDGPTSTDRLGVLEDVQQMASVVMTRAWPPPLSVGLYGDWGSGKSSFMLMMEKRIDEIAGSARKAGAENTVFVGDVVQIRFNAWHYMDTDLWANLATEIFGKLSDHVFGEQDKNGAERRELYRQLESVSKQRDKIQAEQTRIDALRNQADSDYEAARKATDNLRGRLSALGELKADDREELLRDHPELKRAFQEVAKGLKLGDAAEAFEKVDDFLEKLPGLAGRTGDALSRAARDPLGMGILLATTGAALLIWLCPSLLPGLIEEWIGKVGDTISAVATVVTGLVTAAGPHMKHMSNLVSLAGKATQLADTAVERRNSRLRTELTQLERLESEAKQTLDERQAEIDHLKMQIKEVESGRRLEAFLHERISSPDYAERLGIVAIVRRDFKEIYKTLSNGIEVPDANGGSRVVRVERVILYIDDLDRCTPRRVVDVLQAVHLLLAIKMFVVIVAVDPRWLLNSLRWHYRELFTSKSEQDDVSDEERSTWESSPQNYMDKIFQIPFTLRPMTSEGYAQLVGSLFEKPQQTEENEAETGKSPDAGAQRDDRKDDTAEPIAGAQADETVEGPAGAAQSDAASAESAGPGPSETTPPGAAGGQPGSQAPQDTTQGSEPATDPSGTPSPDSEIDLKPEGLILKDLEETLLMCLQPLVPTPRSAKRLINTYRMIRARLDGPDLKRFIDEGEFVAVQLLLGILIGFSGIAADVFRVLRHTSESSFWNFVEALRPRIHGDHSTSKTNPLNRKGLTDAEAWRSEELRRALDNVRKAVKKPESEELQKAFEAADAIHLYRQWLDEVARYSFRAGHVVTTLSRRS